MPQPTQANSTTTAALRELRRRLPGGLRFHAETLRLMRTLTWPAIDLGIRLWLAQLFFASGLIKVGNWQTALYLSANEYPVSWLDPVTAAYIGAAIEVIAPIFLALGLMTRYAALPMLILTLVIQFSYRAFDSQLCWVVLLGWCVVHGASTWSLDNLLRRGFADSALPLASTVARASHWIRTQCTPSYLSVVRMWFALALLQPEATQPSFGGGWGGVLKWCDAFRTSEFASLEADPRRAAFDLIIVHLDADVADQQYADCGAPAEKLAADAGFMAMPFSMPCPPAAPTVARVESLVGSWLGLAAPGAKTIFCVPSKSTEAWLAAALLHDKADLMEDLECEFNVEGMLARLPKGQRVRKTAVQYQTSRTLSRKRGPSMCARVARPQLFSKAVCQR